MTAVREANLTCSYHLITSLQSIGYEGDIVFAFADVDDDRLGNLDRLAFGIFQRLALFVLTLFNHEDGLTVEREIYRRLGNGDLLGLYG